MKNALKWIWQHLFPLPEVGRLEAFIARAMLAYVLMEFFPIFTPPAVQPVPVGLAHGFDLTWLGHTPTLEFYRLIFTGVLVVYVLGFGLPVVLPVLAVMQILPFTLTNSQGFTNHSHHILSVVLLAQALVAVCFPRGAWLQPRAIMNGWLLVASQAGIATAYLISVCSKLWASGGMWLFHSHYIALDLVKTMRQNYYSALDPRYATDPPNVLWMLEHPTATAVIFDMGFFVEALIVLSVGTRWLALAFGIATIMMHRSINALMGLEFFQNESMLAVFFVNVPFLITLLWAGCERMLLGRR
jgi:hypothetical protein